MKKQLFWFLLVSSALALCPTLGMTAQQGAQAQPERGAGRGPAAQGEMARGTITSVGVDRIEIKKLDGTAQVVMVNDQTRYRQGQQEIHIAPIRRLGSRVRSRLSVGTAEEGVCCRRDSFSVRRDRCRRMRVS